MGEELDSHVEEDSHVVAACTPPHHATPYYAVDLVDSVWVHMVRPGNMKTIRSFDTLKKTKLVIFIHDVRGRSLK